MLLLFTVVALYNPALQSVHQDPTRTLIYATPTVVAVLVLTTLVIVKFSMRVAPYCEASIE